MRTGQTKGQGERPAVPAQRRLRSLRNQLLVIPIVVLLAGLVAAVGVVLFDAQARIAAEVASAMRLGRGLVTTSLHNIADASSPALAYEQLAEDLPRVRHVRFELLPSDGTLFRGSSLRIGDNPPPSRPWLARLLAPAPQEQVFPVIVQNDTIGEIRLLSNSSDEIAEIVGEVRLFSGTLLALCLLIVASISLVVRRSLRPVKLLADGFDRLERGDYRPIQPIRVVELRRVGQQFNRVVQSLCRVTSDNHLLIDKLLSVQEQERKQLAAELHDEFGPALFGTRAEAACILKLLPADGRRPAQIRTHARAIAELTEGLQKLNYRMLDRLRPLVLEQMGLSEGLRQLLASWQARHPHVAWSLQMPRNLDEPSEAISLTLYRVVQEAVTNAIRHAQASVIEIGLELRSEGMGGDCQSAPGARSVLLSVADNGRGLPHNLRYGFGLLGMTERVRRLGGTLTIMNAHPTGVVVLARIPEREQAQVAEPMHADPVD